MLGVLAIQKRFLQRRAVNEIVRSFSSTIPSTDEAAAQVKAEKAAERQRRKELANEYNNRRAAYNRQVSSLRKEYAAEVAVKRAQTEAQESAKKQINAREKFERQRLKNIQSAQNAVKAKHIREERHLEFQEELRIAQIDRDAKKARFTLARQMVIDELEKEAPLWLTSPEEVNAAFTGEAEQELWGRAHGIMGAPLPTEDADFWKYETHTWHMKKTYKTRGDLILEQFEDEAFLATNIDPAYWTPSRIKYRDALEEKAKLRAMVRDAGRRALLIKQQEMLQERYSMDSSAVRPAMPAPNVTVLRDVDAMEKEGVKFLLSDPTRFFDFADNVADNNEVSEDAKRTDYAGPMLGLPVGLKNPIAFAPGANSAFPVTIGSTSRPDKRTEKEKKRQDREQQMMAAASAGSNDEKDDNMIDIDDTIPEHMRVDYTEEIRYDSDDEWDARLDPETDQELYNVPVGMRIKEIDQEFVAQKLEEHINFLDEQIRQDTENARLQLGAIREGDGIVDTLSRAPEGSTYYINTEDGKSYTMQDLGIDHDEVDDILSSLTDEQLVYMHAIETEAGDTPLSSEELREKLSGIPGMTDVQISKIVSLEETLASKDEINNY